MKIVKCIVFAIFILAVAFFLTRTIGKTIYSQTIDGSINESMYIDVNCTKQWINIYEEDTDNLVLLYLYVGSGSSTSDIDYKFTSKWADVYTVIIWDQHNC